MIEEQGVAYLPKGYTLTVTAGTIIYKWAAVATDADDDAGASLMIALHEAQREKVRKLEGGLASQMLRY
ncbi:unnamed protein product [Rodentolepis nana]|uniref:Transcriptional regulator n=1 Tax=Rodentolepis nana TaxID=102285 RepID=A0A0R3TX36_RODNA|nr:unnamed protein product [Rodentolepis nana]